jgi:O-antigen ligase
MLHFKPAMTPFWLFLWSASLSMGWLLPNHQRPWTSFHSDAWIALALSLATTAVILRTPGPMPWHRITVIAALLSLIPWLQYAFNVVPLAGNALISSAYLAGFVMALLTSAQWEKHSPGQLGDGLFLAISIAAICSVGLQLQQWLGLDGLELWTMGGGPDRPFANLGQPNQLGTLLLWGLLAGAWGLIRERISGWTAMLVATYLLFGIALTGSRTAWVGVGLLVAATWLWRRLWTNSKTPWIAAAFGLYFVGCVVLIGLWRNALSMADLDNVTRMSSELRPLAWTVFLDAIGQHPLLGYGWNQTTLAQLAAANEHPPLHTVFSYSHNLFLDLVLWCGFPLGLLASGAFLWWFWTCLRAVNSAENAVLVLFLLVIANHAMLELPLYYAYFLLPVGMVMGALDTRQGAQPVLQMGRMVAMGFWLATTVLLALIIRDYSRVESSYQKLSLEWSRIKITIPVGPPDVLLLTQWHDYIKYARIEPKAGLSTEELAWMRNLTGLYPSGILLHKFATILALNQLPDEARLWLKRMCKTVPAQECHDVEIIWAKQSLKYPEIAAIPWPVKKWGAD